MVYFMENPTKMDELGAPPPFQETSIHMSIYNIKNMTWWSINGYWIETDTIYINIQICRFTWGIKSQFFFRSWLYHLNPKASKTIQCTLKSSCATCEMVISFFFNPPSPRVLGRMNRYLFRWTFLPWSVSHEFEGPCSKQSLG
jgi:hypothetical protein